MGKKTAAVLVLTALCCLMFISGVRAVTEPDGTIDFPGGVHLICPINQTYTSNQLTLSLTFLSTGFTGSINYNLTYNIDDAYNGTIPLTSGSGAPQHMTVSVPANVALPALPDGKHQLTITEVADIPTEGSNSKSSGVFQPKTLSDGSTVYEAVYIDTVQFTIDTGSATSPAESATPSPTPNPTGQAVESNPTPTVQPPEAEPQQLPPTVAIVILVAAAAVYIAVFIVLATRKGRT